MVPLFESRSHNLCNTLSEAAVSRKLVDMQEEFQKLTFDVIGLVAMGMDFNSQRGDGNIYGEAWEKVLSQLMFQFYFPLPKWMWKWLGFLPSIRTFNKSMQILEDAVQHSIEMRKSAPIDPESSDLLSLMLLDQKNAIENNLPIEYTDQRIKRELLTFIFAGHDTTRSTMCWMLYYIITQPEVYEKVMDELKCILGDSLSFENVDLSQFKYTKCVLNETLRLRPPAPVRGRTLVHSDTIAGVTLPKGSHVV